MKKRLLTMLLALVAIIMPIGAWEQDYVDIVFSESGIATFYYSGSSFIIPEGISASIITGVEKNPNGTVTVIEEDVTGIIPADCAVILRGVASETYRFDQTQEGGAFPNQIYCLAPMNLQLILKKNISILP